MPPVNFTVRSFLVDKSPSVAAISDALDGVAINPVMAGSDRPANLQSPLNSRRVNNCLFAFLITTDTRSFNSARSPILADLSALVSLNERSLQSAKCVRPHPSPRRASSG